MAKLDAYKYKEGEATLEFGFEHNDKIKINKENFLKMLKQAVKDLELELFPTYRTPGPIDGLQAMDKPFGVIKTNKPE